MDKLLVALCVFVFGSALALAQSDTTEPIPADITLIPLSKLDAEQAKAARATAKAKWKAMTPDEQAAVRKALLDKHLRDLNAVDEYVLKTEPPPETEHRPPRSYGYFLPILNGTEPSPKPGRTPPQEETAK
jgi:hypothetical protein